jgi:predicted RNA binding protein YcfA (HicA-like mRNA interferase family)
MSKLPVISGQEVLKALSKFGFVAVRQSSSHVIMRKGGITISVPMHHEVRRGTLRKIITQAGLTVEQFNDVL